MSDLSAPIIVKKFGGSSVADVDRIRSVAAHVVAAHRSGQRVVVVVSAMGKTTDELVRLSRQVAKQPDRREMDMLLTAGERITMALLAMAIRDLGVAATSLTGSQSGIITNDQQGNAQVVEVRPYRVEDALRDGHVVIVAGFQGVSYRREVTTLGRGGSDTTAVALAAALGAHSAEIFTDIDGVHSADPRIHLDAQRLAEIDYDAMLALARGGARVLSAEAIAYAQRRGIALYVRASDGRPGETLIRAHAPAPPSQLWGVALRADAVLWQLTLDSTEAEALDTALAAQPSAIVMHERRTEGDLETRSLWLARPPGDKSGDGHRAWLAALRGAMNRLRQHGTGTLLTAVFAAVPSGLQRRRFDAAVKIEGAEVVTAQHGATCVAMLPVGLEESAVARLLAAMGD